MRKRCGTVWYRGRVFEEAEATVPTAAFDYAEALAKRKVRRKAAAFVKGLKCVKGCQPLLYDRDDIQFECDQLWGRPSRDLPGYYLIRIELRYRFPVSCPPAETEGPGEDEGPVPEEEDADKGTGEGSGTGGNSDTEKKEETQDEPETCVPTISLDLIRDGGPSVAQDYVREVRFTASSSLGHELGVVTIESVVMKAVLGTSQLPSDRYDIELGDETDETPESVVKTNLSFKSTREVIAVIRASYKCPTCGSTAQKEVEFGLNTSHLKIR